ncbi:izumo sperm-egg fusion protein 3 isoform B [Alligator mississippiensis]|uniref:Izumo sperm-egg fusion protein 3 isoform B n=2 Tax=Alligator mississippiensis TaxID=8496 RepID=A0A151NN75_ALLMI|nr:izumo sperm-egg fusion protein 3 isoform B [Alligator mississippiensis]
MPCALLLLLIVLCLQEAGSCLHCDRSFLEALEALLGEVVPPTVPQRDTLIQHHIEAFTQLYTLHLREKQHRVLDVRGVQSLKSALTTWLKGVKEEPWKGVNLLQLALAQQRDSLLSSLHGALERFANLAMTEGPVLDCWTCLRINAQCFSGELCGEEDKREVERKEIILYLFLVCECVLLGSGTLLYCVCWRLRWRTWKQA